MPAISTLDRIATEIRDWACFLRRRSCRSESKLRGGCRARDSTASSRSCWRRTSIGDRYS